MTATINVFSMPRVVALLTMGGNTGATLMNYSINRTDFKLSKGIKTEIMFFIKDVDRKAVVLSGSPRIVIVDTRDNRLMMERSLTPVNVQKGLWMFTVSAVDIELWPIGFMRYSILYDRDVGDTITLYTDLGYGPYSSLEVLQGPFPYLPEATTIPVSSFLHLSGSMVSGAYEGAANVGNPSGLHTAVFNVTNFVGTLKIQASLEDQPSADDYDWFDATVLNYTDPVQGPIYVEALGQYLWVRFVVTKAVGYDDIDFEKVVFRAF